MSQRSNGSGAKNEREQSHTDKESVSHLPEVCGAARVEVDFWVDLVDARQRVHDDGAVFRLCQDIVVDDEHVLDGFVFGNVVESLFLHSSDVKHVRGLDDLVEVVVLVPLDTGAGRFRLDALGHGERWGRDKVERDVVQRENLDEGVDRSAVLQVSDWTLVQAILALQVDSLKVTVIPLTEPSSSRIQKTSSRLCVGCSPIPSPALMMGTGLDLAALLLLPTAGCRRTTASE